MHRLTTNNKLYENYFSMQVRRKFIVNIIVYLLIGLSIQSTVKYGQIFAKIKIASIIYSM